MKVEYPQYEEGAARPSSSKDAYAEEIPSNRYIVGNKNSQFLYDQESEGPYQEMSKGASLNNKYLEKIAMSGLARQAQKHVVNSSAMAKVGLGVSSASLGISAANYHNGKVTAKASQDKAALERKSLYALNKINNTLSTATLAPAVAKKD